METIIEGRLKWDEFGGMYTINGEYMWNILNPYLGRIVTMSVQTSEEPFPPDFLKERCEKEVEAHIEWARRQMEK